MDSGQGLAKIWWWKVRGVQVVLGVLGLVLPAMGFYGFFLHPQRDDPKIMLAACVLWIGGIPVILVVIWLIEALEGWLLQMGRR